jgi:hypothetical protein
MGLAVFLAESPPIADSGWKVPPLANLQKRWCGVCVFRLNLMSRHSASSDGGGGGVRTHSGENKIYIRTVLFHEQQILPAAGRCKHELIYALIYLD